MSEKVENSTDFQLAPGEKSVYGDKFITSLFTPYMPTQLMCSTTRFVYRAPNTLLGLIPLGSDENVIPIRNIASVSSRQRLRAGRLIFGLIFLIVGLSVISNSIAGGIIAILFGASMLLMCFPATIYVQNPAGSVVIISVSFLDSAKLKRFTTELQNRVFADNAQIHHDEAQAMRSNQNMLSQMQLQQQMLANQQQYAQQQYAQQQYAQQQYAQPQLDQQQYAQPQLDQQQYAQPQQGQQYAQQQYAQPQQGQQYAQPQQGDQQQYAQPPQPPQSEQAPAASDDTQQLPPQQ